MDRIGMGFGPISDVTGFSHKAGMTYLEIQEVLRRKINELVAAHASLKAHIDARNAELISAFDQAMSDLSVPVGQYNSLVAQLNVKLAEITPFTTTSTNYITA